MLFIARVYRLDGLLLANISNCDPRFIGNFWTPISNVVGTRLDMLTTDHPQTDSQIERVNRDIGDVLRSVCATSPKP